jgi:hypothetical protein
VEERLGVHLSAGDSDYDERNVTTIFDADLKDENMVNIRENEQ